MAFNKHLQAEWPESWSNDGVRWRQTSACGGEFDGCNRLSSLTTSLIYERTDAFHSTMPSHDVVDCRADQVRTDSDRIILGDPMCAGGHVLLCLPRALRALEVNVHA